MLAVKKFLKKNIMLVVAFVAAIVSLFITPPSMELLSGIEWRTLGTLFMMLTVLEGFKEENIFRPLLKFAGNLGSLFTLSLFLVFSVFFTSMFVTNDVSLIVFVPITIILFRAGNVEKYILPVITLENIAAVRGSMLMPFGSPQNLFLYSKSGVSTPSFIMHMFPLSALSAVLLVIFIFFICRKKRGAKLELSGAVLGNEWTKEKRRNRFVYIILFIIVIGTIVTRTKFWPAVLVLVILAVLVNDRKLLLRTDYVLLLTFLCFFVFSSSIAANKNIAKFLSSSVTDNEYVWSILLSQVISNVPASIVLWPFSKNLWALLYGLDSAGLVSVIGSLASVINYRIYVREYPENGGKFIKVFTLINWCFFLIVVIPGYILGKMNF